MTELAEGRWRPRWRLRPRRSRDERHGAPRTATGAPIDFWIIGMGKLGARELNVSSDIDLIYVYGKMAPPPAGADGAGRHLGARVLLAGRAHAACADRRPTDDGFVFRVDLAAPNGNSGPPVVSLAMLEGISRCRAAVGALRLAEEPGGGAARQA